MPPQSLPSLNGARSQEEILALNGRLISFDCMVQDMYDEEYFVQVLGDLPTSLYYKYFTDLCPERAMGETGDNRWVSQRGTLLGVSAPHLSSWLAPSERPKQCLVKLYDSNVRAFKLNELVTFVGHLEFAVPSDEEMKDDSGQQELQTGIPNERLLPQLHVFTCVRSRVLNENPVLPLSKVSEDLVRVEAEALAETRGRLVAVLKLLLSND